MFYWSSVFYLLYYEIQVLVINLLLHDFMVKETMTLVKIIPFYPHRCEMLHLITIRLILIELDMTEWLSLSLFGFPSGSAGKESARNVGDMGSILGLGRSSGEGNGCPFQYSGMENSMDYTVPWGHRVRHDWVTFTFSPNYVNLFFMSLHQASSISLSFPSLFFFTCSMIKIFFWTYWTYLPKHSLEYWVTAVNKKMFVS